METLSFEMRVGVGLGIIGIIAAVVFVSYTASKMNDVEEIDVLQSNQTDLEAPTREMGSAPKMEEIHVVPQMKIEREELGSLPTLGMHRVFVSVPIEHVQQSVPTGHKSIYQNISMQDEQ